MKAYCRLYFLPILLVLALSGTSSVFAQNTSGATHIVQSGETLYRISRIYNVSLDELYALNPSAKDGVRVGQSIALPRSVKSSGANTSSGGQSNNYRFHTVRPGDTLYSIARAYGVSVDEILSANSTVKAAESLPGGIILRIPPASKGSTPTTGGYTATTASPAAPPVAPTEKVTGLKLITVDAGMTVYSLLRMTGWNEDELYKYNPQVRNGLKAGMAILVPDTKLPDNKAITNSTAMDFGVSGTANVTPNIVTGVTVALALPFAEDGNNTRFRDYYQGFLLKLKDAKAKGISIDLYTVDVSASNLSSAISELDALPAIDLIIGGVSTASQTALAGVAKRKGALYTIPFTSTPLQTDGGGGSKPLRIYQINTPHVRLYAAAADKFVQVYGNGTTHVHFVSYTASAKEDKSDFIAELRQTLARNGISYSEGNSANLDSDLAALKTRSGRVVVIPSSASRSAADLTLKALVKAADTAEGETYTGPAFTAFGYPEWQTYASRLLPSLRKTESTFFATFFTEPSSEDYKAFQQEYISWYGVSIGNTFPRYSILGYDTAGYFLDPSSVGNIYKNGRYDGYYDGIQSRFDFRPSPMISNLYSNIGVFFVRYQKDGYKTLKL